MPRKHVSIPIFIPQAACPFQCIYCNQHSISGALHFPDDQEIKATIDTYLSTCHDVKDIEIAFFGGTFTGLPASIQEHLLSLVHPYLSKGVKGIRLSTRPDYIDQPTLDLLGHHGVTTIELGAQSMDDEVLANSGRGHTVANVETASALILKNGFRLGLQMMFGLPGDNPAKTLATAHKIIAMGAHETRIYPTLIIKGTELEWLYRQNYYRALEIEETIEALIPVVAAFEKAGVIILRLGLHPSKDLKENEFIAGPWHPALRQVIKGRIRRQMIISELKPGQDVIKISGTKSEINEIVGYKRENVLFFDTKGIRLITETLSNINH